MLRTITIGSHVTVQGVLVKQLEDGKITVRVGKDTFTGKAIPAQA